MENMNMTINIEGNESVIMRVVALLRAIPDVKIRTRKETLKSGLIPNAKTKQAIEDAATGNGCKKYANSTEMFKSLGINV
jgi:hypothetical protein